MDLFLWVRTWALLWILAACRGQSEEDEKRPYKFAFAIEGYQHRSEEKDERGIIMGEFGFVTGDGVYHVTVYATDENGNFKILKMKNFYIGLPGEGTTVAPSRAPPPSTRATTPSPPTSSTTKSPILKHLEGLMGCSGCIVPNKNRKNGDSVAGTPPGSVYGEGLLDDRFGGGADAEGPGRPGNPLYGGGTPANPSGSVGGSGGGGSSAYPGVGGGGGGVSGGGIIGGGEGGGGGGGVFTGQRPSGGRKPGGGNQLPSKGPSQNLPGAGPSSQGAPGLRPEGNYGSSQPGKPGAPGTGAIGQSRPGPSSSGLPPGMTMDDLMALLYKFNYTLKYHGHHESGYRNGDKEGDYFFNGRDGLGRNVKYIANEFGFQPNITLVDLGLQSPDTPQGENEENELRGNEFKWFYKR